MTIWAAALLVVVPLSQPTGDAERLQGEWTRVRSVIDGKEKDGTAADAISLRIEKDRVYLLRDGKKAETPEIRLTLETSTMPRLLDVAVAKGPSLEGIYKLEGKRFTVCLQTGPGTKDRPTAFDAPVGSGLTVIVYEKKEP